MKKLIKLNARGIAHFIVPAIVVVAVAAGGTFALVESHADPAASPAKAVALAGKCKVTNLPTSVPVTANLQSYHPKIVVTNTGTENFKTNLGVAESATDSNGGYGGGGIPGIFKEVPAGQSITIDAKSGLHFIDNTIVKWTFDPINTKSKANPVSPAFKCPLVIKVTAS